MKIIPFKNLNTKNLLSYYRAERKRFFLFASTYTCGCGCNDFYWTLDNNHDNEKNKYDEWKAYLLNIKGELNTREHIIS